jgi:hypothetical protein
MGHHRPSHRSELDLNDLQVKTYCRRCGAMLVFADHKWRVVEDLEAA